MTEEKQPRIRSLAEFSRDAGEEIRQALQAAQEEERTLEAVDPDRMGLIREYRRAAASSNGKAPSPVCGERSAVLSMHDHRVGATVQLYCDNDECPAREIDITVQRGFLDDPAERLPWSQP